MKKSIGEEQVRSSIVLAVTGHRYIKQSTKNAPTLLSVIETIKFQFPAVKYQVYSCLAEGADQLLAQLLMDNLHAVLIHVLPLEAVDYLRDFEGEKSIKGYYSLKSSANKTINLAEIYTRPFAYRIANQYMLDKCDLLIALWDGKPANGVGGTGEMVAMARDKNIPLIWIHCNKETVFPVITVERIPN